MPIIPSIVCRNDKPTECLLLSYNKVTGGSGSWAGEHSQHTTRGRGQLRAWSQSLPAAPELANVSLMFLWLLSPRAPRPPAGSHSSTPLCSRAPDRSILTCETPAASRQGFPLWGAAPLPPPPPCRPPASLAVRTTRPVSKIAVSFISLTA